MPYNVKILADSIGPNGKRITTWELTYPRMVHAEFMTHRDFSRNAASSRAIPIEKMIERVRVDPAMPVWWGKNQKGMQAKEELTGEEQALAQIRWLMARDWAVDAARNLMETGLHKQIANRVLEPWMFITVICTATEYANWFALRCHPDAQPEIKWVADEMARQYADAQPRSLVAGEWHLPLVDADDIATLTESLRSGTNQHDGAPVDLSCMKDSTLRKVSVGRCARVSYLTHDGKRDMAADIELHDRLAQSGHWSPFEHVAQALNPEITPGDREWRSGNLVGWRQYRKSFVNEVVR